MASHRLSYRSPRLLHRLFLQLQKQQSDGQFCDVILKGEGESFPVHSCLLSACSPFLANALSSTCDIPGYSIYSVTQDGCSRRVLHVPGLKSCFLLPIVRYIYTSELEVCPAEAHGVLEAAKRLQIPELNLLKVERGKLVKSEPGRKLNRDCTLFRISVHDGSNKTQIRASSADQKQIKLRKVTDTALEVKSQGKPHLADQDKPNNKATDLSQSQSQNEYLDSKEKNTTKDIMFQVQSEKITITTQETPTEMIDKGKLSKTGAEQARDDITSDSKIESIVKLPNVHDSLEGEEITKHSAFKLNKIYNLDKYEQNVPDASIHKEMQTQGSSYKDNCVMEECVSPAIQYDKGLENRKEKMGQYKNEIGKQREYIDKDTGNLSQKQTQIDTISHDITVNQKMTETDSSAQGGGCVAITGLKTSSTQDIWSETVREMFEVAVEDDKKEEISPLKNDLTHDLKETRSIGEKRQQSMMEPEEQEVELIKLRKKQNNLDWEVVKEVGLEHAMCVEQKNEQLGELEELLAFMLNSSPNSPEVDIGGVSPVHNWGEGVWPDPSSESDIEIEVIE